MMTFVLSFVAVSAVASEPYLYNPNGQKVLCFPREESFKDFFACGDNVNCRVKVVVNQGGVFVPNKTKIGVINVQIFGYYLIMIREGVYSGERFYTSRDWIRGY